MQLKVQKPSSTHFYLQRMEIHRNALNISNIELNGDLETDFQNLKQYFNVLSRYTYFRGSCEMALYYSNIKLTNFLKEIFPSRKK